MVDQILIAVILILSAANTLLAYGLGVRKGKLIEREAAIAKIKREAKPPPCPPLRRELPRG